MAAIGSFNGHPEIMALISSKRPLGHADITECSEGDLDRLAGVCKEILTPTQRSVQNVTKALQVYGFICHLHNENAEIQGKVSRVAATVLNTLNDALRAEPKDLRTQVFQSYSSSVLNRLFIHGDSFDEQDQQFVQEERILPLRDLPAPLKYPKEDLGADACADEALREAREQEFMPFKDLSIAYPNEDRFPPLDAFARSIVRAANELYDIYPEQAKNCIEYVNRIVAEIDYWKSNPTLLSWQKKQALEKLPSPVCLLQLKELVSKLNCTTDPQWELKLRTVLTATKTLYVTLRWRVVFALLDPITQLWQSPQFPGFTELETVELIRSLFEELFTWPDEHSKEMSTLLSRFGEGIVTQLEQALVHGDTKEQIACVHQLMKLSKRWKGIPITVRSLDKALAQGFSIDELIKKFPQGKAYKILSSLAPEVAQEYMNILLGLKSKVSSVNIIDKKAELARLEEMAESKLPHYIPEARSMIQRFVDQQFAAIISDIAQGHLETIGDKDAVGELVGHIVNRYKNNMETFVKALGDHAKTLFKIYGGRRLMVIPWELSDGGDVDGALNALKDYLQIPLEFRVLNSRTWETDPDNPRTFNPKELKPALNSVFNLLLDMSEKLNMNSGHELMKFGQVCSWLKKLIFLEMPCLDLPDDVFEAFVKQIAGCVPHDPDVDMVDQATEKPSTWILQSLDGNGYEDPVALIQALPLNEAQKARLIQVYRQTS